jgi:fructokinase
MGSVGRSGAGDPVEGAPGSAGVDPVRAEAGRTRVLGIGEILWDLLPDGPRLGGAPFNVAAHLGRLGCDAAFLTAVGADDLGREAVAVARSLGVRTDLVQVVHDAPTGTAGVVIDDAGLPRFEIRSPAAYERVHGDPGTLAAIAALDPEAVVFGTLAQRFPSVREATRAVVAAHPDAMRVYDVNLREGCWSPSLVDELLAEASIAKLSDGGVAVLATELDLPSGSLEAFAAAAAARYDLRAVCMTRGADGATAWTADGVISVRGLSIEVIDTIGAGDAFTACFVGWLLRGRPAAEALRMANALGALVASRAGAIPRWDEDELAAFEREHQQPPPAGASGRRSSR